MCIRRNLNLGIYQLLAHFLLCMTGMVLLSVVPGKAFADEVPQATAQENPRQALAEHSGRVLLWPQLQTHSPIQINVNANAKMIARIESDAQGRLQVWELTPTLQLGKPLLDTTGNDFVAMAFEWLGESLLYSRVEGVKNLNDAMNLPDDLYDRSLKSLLWNPTTNAIRVVFPNISWRTCVVDEEGKKVASSIFDEDIDSTTIIVTQLSDGKELERVAIKADLADPLWWGKDGKSLFLLGKIKIQGDAENVSFYDALLRIAFDGTMKQLTPSWIEREGGRYSAVRTSSVRSIPTITPLSENGEVAIFLHGEPEVWIGYYDVNGPVRHRKFYERDLPELWRQGVREIKRLEPIAVTPDGHGIIFQNTREVEQQDGRAIAQVCIWNLDTNAIISIGKAPLITDVFGWQGGRYLVFKAIGATRKIRNEYEQLSEFGIIEVWRKPKEAA